MRLKRVSPLPKTIHIEAGMTTDQRISSEGKKVLIMGTGEAFGTGGVSLTIEKVEGWPWDTGELPDHVSLASTLL